MSMKTDYGEALSMAAEQATEQTEAYWAWRAGKTVQIFCVLDNSWRDLAPNSVLHSHLILRRKPQPKLRPWKPEEVPIGARVREKHCDWTGTIVAAVDCGFMIHVKTAWLVEWGNAAHYMFSTDGGKTWAPVGVVE